MFWSRPRHTFTVLGNSARSSFSLQVHRLPGQIDIWSAGIRRVIWIHFYRFYPSVISHHRRYSWASRTPFRCWNSLRFCSRPRPLPRCSHRCRRNSEVSCLVYGGHRSMQRRGTAAPPGGCAAGGRAACTCSWKRAGRGDKWSRRGAMSGARSAEERYWICIRTIDIGTMRGPCQACAPKTTQRLKDRHGMKRKVPVVQRT